jgi:hypothetical protein
VPIVAGLVVLLALARRGPNARPSPVVRQPAVTTEA